MNKKIIITVLFLCFAYITKAQNPYDVTFYIHEFEDSVIYIESTCGSETKIEDTIFKEKNESFHWKKKDMPQGLYLIKNKQESMFSFLLGNSHKFSIEIYPNGEANVVGCQENDAFLLYQKENKKYQKNLEMYKINVQKAPSKKDSLMNIALKQIDTFTVFQKQFFQTYPNNLISVLSESMLDPKIPRRFVDGNHVTRGLEKEYAYYFRIHYWDNFHFNDNRILYTPYFMNKFDSYINKITMQEADSINVAIDDFEAIAKSRGGKEYADYIINYYLNFLPKLPFSFNEVTYVHIVDKYVDENATYLSPREIQFHKTNVDYLRKFLPLKQMPNIVLKDLNGEEKSLYSLKNKFIVLYFFSSSCENCKKNIDVLEEFYKNRAKYDAEIFSIDLDQDIDNSIKRQQNHPYNWIIAKSTPQEMEQYGFHLDHTPEIYILNQDKLIINKTAIYDHIEKTIINYEKTNSKK